MGAMETLLARIGATQNPGHLVAQGVDKITTPGYPADDALRGYVAGAPAFQPTIGGMLKQTGTDLAAQSGGFLRSLMAGDYEAAMNSSLFPLGAMTVYHGSPHKFDAFDLSKIGTGEGAQAYGHGLYFAENPKVAGSYAAQLAGNAVSNAKASAEANAQITSVFRQTDFNGPEDITRDWLDMVAQQTRDGGDDAVAREIAALNPGDFKKASGNLYHVDIPDDEIAKMLDWDKPLSEQPESVRIALQSQFRIVKELDSDGPWVAYFGNHSLDASKTKKSLIEKFEKNPAALLTAEGGKVRRERQAMSELLNTLGIPGIKYLDGGSRGAGEGSRNLVLFDDKLAKVLKRE